MGQEMLNFDYYNPTHIIFGKNRLEELNQVIPADKKVLLLYGGGSVKKFGTLDKVKAVLKNREIGEFGGIEANPTYETLIKAIKLVKEENYDFLLAVGGGSVIDGTKFVAAGALFDGDPIHIFGSGIGENRPITEALPFGTVLTLPATGSEMNSGGVVTFVEKKAKLGFGSPFTYPVFSLLDPELTYTLPTRQLANGIMDAYVHVMEQYMTYPVGALLQDRYAESLLQTLIEIGPDVIDENNHDYNTRATFMWSATNALNGTLSRGVPQDWASHGLGHEITALYGIDHARTLAIVLPSLLNVRRNEKREKLVQYAERVWGITNGDEDAKIDAAIAKTREFFESLGAGTRFNDYGLGEEVVEQLVNQLERHGLTSISERGDQTLEVSRQIYTNAL
ncbi:iron-containing alcohol dehydrogenase [Listeria ivanovii]|uniref:Iron-containing alcohol dehydrogenase n=1 Tax=Listeria ivanovii subsp. londoniensis TaxID=202752 RepID=A0ABS1G2W6_LISIV|nr:iron-containing alcohol dehydrogenase [Listeria ivanovii]AIS58943.1 aldehyde reductase [Listeria ivanovii subsp. londoniensis]AIS61745.1 aldehyde reductase [Listeria ivanovii subsp. londoniensis]MBK1961203.1 iron-containing alcohol dehydrogenase [Listeria ivanovii subsp. londoniensis]MBK1965811.1 iron-containing alcohol dehydrogenase [Listeria ivanovii subsp. londoniensis]MBK1984842.1 iron-containing alcohol dehydrogenase [Listeria ivanovii subsp. londoniensis]